MEFKDAVTITLGDRIETNVGMKRIGSLAKEGFTLEDLIEYKNNFEKLNAMCKLYKLECKDVNYNVPGAYFLIIKNGVKYLLDKDNTADILYNEQEKLEKDKFMCSYGRIVNKKARYNLMFGEKYEKADYENKKGIVIPFDSVPELKRIKDKLPLFTNEKTNNLFIGANYYYDIKICGICYHGDGERKKTIGIRLGATIPLCFQWYYNSKPVGKRIKFMINHGDIYFMCEKATGNDWKKRNLLGLRHAAGCDKFINSQI